MSITRWGYAAILVLAALEGASACSTQTILTVFDHHLQAEYGQIAQLNRSNPIRYDDPRFRLFPEGDSLLVDRSDHRDVVLGTDSSTDRFIAVEIILLNGAKIRPLFRVERVFADVSGIHVQVVAPGQLDQVLELPAEIAITANPDPLARHVFSLLDPSHEESPRENRLFDARHSSTSADSGPTRTRAEFDALYAPVARLGDPEIHPGRVIERARRNPESWTRFLDQDFGGSEADFWDGLALLSAHPEIFDQRWSHGSTSASLALLPRTQNTLLPTGVLLNRGLTPFSGELQEGIAEIEGVGGMNRTMLSGVRFANVSTAVHFADRVGSRGFSWERSIQKLQDIIEQLRAGHVTGAVFPVAVLIRQLRIWDLARFDRECPRQVRELIGLLQQHAPTFGGLTRLQNELSRQPISLTAEERAWIEHPFPVVFGSNTLGFQAIDNRGHALEYHARFVTDPVTHRTHDVAELGRDIDFVFVDPIHMAAVRARLDATPSSRGVRVLDIRILRALRAITPYASVGMNRMSALHAMIASQMPLLRVYLSDLSAVGR